MKKLLSIASFFLVLGQWSCISSQNISKQNQKMDSNKLTYLALGDSYTIGEGVEAKDRYPHQAVEMLKESGLIFSEPKIIATTGWTTDELANGIKAADIEGENYDLVTLLIGVNNQYRGRPVENYRNEFRQLLEDAITFAKGDKSHVVVLSIPDWGVTPFAVNRGSDQEKVAREIDQYNQAKKAISEEMGIAYIDITEHYRINGMKSESVVSDQLHPSGMIYQYWAEKLVEIVEGMEF
ncbi:lysophospholipase L1-like esterase [Belliella baltica DSM 15883]|uniref:Lysophospholipase L1-like esterase n=1 Tax=Belliella baltica (strain DSM 15883 / CIP 108006 / LMG 21964 / BA134) TaxID=866536 RepID=I3Z6J3_BELBD|nr:SGNH/GDSL hydrolase family protein [Belliella baltica]AFL84861.1 lysophospholipase L1-like esterase [Belliella baltica DSM 15883]